MLGHRFCLLLAITLSLSCLLLVPNHALAYVGPGPGVELIPYFYSLLVWVGLALTSILLWPVQALLFRLRGGRPQAHEAGHEGQLRSERDQPSASLPSPGGCPV